MVVFFCIALLASAVLAAKPRIFVLTDIANEPDDAMSLTRFLLYSNQFSVQGICATTSVWLPTETHIEQIQSHIDAYRNIVENLNAHVESPFPSADELLGKTYNGYPAFGMDAVGEGKQSNGSQALKEAIDQSEEETWVTIWGGANVLAQAVWEYEQDHSVEDVDKFLSKLRVYSISDQDDAGPWLRHRHNSIFWIVSIHTFNIYNQATWVGISGENLYLFDEGGPDSSLVTNDWLDDHIRSVSTFGSTYPDFLFIMEGDTPSFLYLIQNGLSVRNQPRWGSWGGRYGRVSRFDNTYVNTIDCNVPGVNGANFTSAQSTIWRWRNAYQWDFAGRMLWTTTSDIAAVNHNPVVVVNGSKEVAEPLYFDVSPGDAIFIDASESFDPDNSGFANVTFWQYLDVSAFERNPESTPVLQVLQHELNGLTATVMVPTKEELLDKWSLWLSGRGANEDDTSLHVIVEIWDNGTPSLVGYKRVVLTVKL